MSNVQGATSRRGDWSVAVVLGILLARGIALPIPVFGIDIILVAAWIVVLLNFFRFGLRDLYRPAVVLVSLTALISGYGLASALAGSEIGDVAALLNALPVLGLSWVLASANPRRLLATLTVALTFHVGFAAVELVTGRTFVYSTWKLLEATYVGGVPRVSSTVGDPNYFALCLLILAGLIFHIGSSIKLSQYQKGVALVGMLLIIPTFSRTGLVALLLVGLAVLVRRPRLAARALIVAPAAAASLLTVYLLSSSFADSLNALMRRFSDILQFDASISSRARFQDFGIETLLESGLLGVGAGRFETLALDLYDPARPLDFQTQVLNTYLEALLAGGVLAFGALLVLLGLVAGRQRGSGGTYVAVWLGVLFALFTLDTLEFPQLWLFIGTGLALLDSDREQHNFGAGRELQQRRGAT